MKKLLAGTGNLIFIAVTLYLCYFIVSAAYNRTPSFFGYRMLRVVTDSMEPVFAGGDCIIIKDAGEEELAIGDIVTFVSGDPSLEGAYNTHRIYDIARDYTTGEAVYYTKGDSNTWTDEYTVLREDIVGKSHILRILDHALRGVFSFAWVSPLSLVLSSSASRLRRGVSSSCRDRPPRTCPSSPWSAAHHAPRAFRGRLILPGFPRPLPRSLGKDTTPGADSRSSTPCLRWVPGRAAPARRGR